MGFKLKTNPHHRENSKSIKNNDFNVIEMFSVPDIAQWVSGRAFPVDLTWGLPNPVSLAPVGQFGSNTNLASEMLVLRTCRFWRRLNRLSAVIALTHKQRDKYICFQGLSIKDLANKKMIHMCSRRPRETFMIFLWEKCCFMKSMDQQT